MKKRRLAWGLALTLLLTACGGTTAPESTASDSQAVESTAESASAEAAGKLKPGTYSAKAMGMDGDVEVMVTVSEDRIEKVEIGEQNETSGICENVYAQIPAQVVEYQSLGVDSVAGATITSGAVKRALEDAMEQAGADVKAWKAVEIPSQAKDEEFTYDVVVCGGGLSGIMAACEAARAGAKVALIEKTGMLGGTSITASGNMLAAPTEADQATMKEGWLARSSEQTLNPIDEEMLDALIAVSPQVMGRYDEAGVSYRIEKNEKNGSITVKINPNEASKKNAEAIQIPSKKANAKGAPALIDAFKKQMETLGVQVYLNTPATKLLQQENGAVVGVVSETEKYGTKTFHAGAVVLSTGDYAHNKELDEKLNPRGRGEYSASAVGNTGDGLNMALEAGGVLNPFQDSMSGVFNANPYDMPMIGDPTNGYPFEALLLNMSGERVYKEDGGSHPQKFRFVREDGLNTAWCLMDAEIAKKFIKLDEYLKQTENNHPIIRVYQADSIAELAEKMELDGAVVQAAVDRYNELCAKGEDEDFGKAPEFLSAIDEGPFYAALLYDATRGDYGGIKTSPKAEVVTESGEAIPGLYASGIISSGQFFGDFYPGRQAIAVAAHMGFIAGQSAAAHATAVK